MLEHRLRVINYGATEGFYIIISNSASIRKIVAVLVRV